MQELVPETQVPEGALGRATFDDEGLVGPQVEAAHGVGGVAGGPAVGHLRDGVGLGHAVGIAQGEGNELRLFAEPCQRGTHAAGERLVVLPPDRRRADCLDVPGHAPVAHGIGEVVAGDGAHGVGLELQPRALMGLG